MLSSIGTMEIMIILLVVLLVFGGKEMPQVVRKIVRSISDVQKATQNARNEIQKIMEEEDDSDSDLKG